MNKKHISEGLHDPEIIRSAIRASNEAQRKVMETPGWLKRFRERFVTVLPGGFNTIDEEYVTPEALEAFIAQVDREAEERGFKEGKNYAPSADKIREKALEDARAHSLEDVLNLIPDGDGGFKYLSPDVKEFATQLREALRKLNESLK